MRLALIILALLMLPTFLMVGISCNDKTATLDDNEQGEAEQFADAFIDYALEVMLVADIATERLNKAAELLQNNQISMLECTKRGYQITLIHAYTLHYIDSKPEYQILFPFLYDKDSPPSLGWSMPEFEADPEAAEASYWSYLEDYIYYHDWALQQAVEKIGPPKK